VERHLVDQSKFGANLNPFEIKLIRFENRIGCTVVSAPLFSTAPTRSLALTPAPVAARRCSATTPPPACAVAGPLPPDAAPLRCPRHARAPSLSPHASPENPDPPPPPPSVPCFSSRSDAAPATTFPASAAGPPRGRRHPTGAALPPERRRVGPFPPPHRRSTSSVSPTSALLARCHPGTPPVLTGSTLPSASPHHTAVERVLAPARARAARGDHAGAHATRGSPPRPRGCFGRPRVAGRHAPWAIASGQFSAQYYARGFKCFSILLNSRNCFKFQKFIETCRNSHKLQNKFCIIPLEPLFIVGLTKLILCSKFLYKILRTKVLN
jgi:hypothetical protein